MLSLWGPPLHTSFEENMSSPFGTPLLHSISVSGWLNMFISYHSLQIVQEHPYIHHNCGKGSYMNLP